MMREPFRIVIRYDDCSARSSLRLEQALVDRAAENGAQVTLGVVPFICNGDIRSPAPQSKRPLPQAKVAFLRNAAASGAAEIALHGCYHQIHRRGHLSEFAGLPFDEQYRRLQLGRREIQQQLAAKITTFIPPWNAYDDNTLKALKLTGFQCLSASLRGPYSETSDVDFLPQSCDLQCLPHLIRFGASGLGSHSPICVVVLHDFDFTESGRTEAWLSIKDFSAVLREIRRHPRVIFRSLRQACEDGKALNGLGLRPYLHWHKLCRTSSWTWRTIVDGQVLWSAEPAPVNPLQVFGFQAYVVGRRFMHRVHQKLRRAA
jgi:hypothetical protein